MPRGDDQAGASARARRRAVRAGGNVRDSPGRVVQADRAAHLQDVSAAPPLRALGLEGDESRREVLDHRDHLRAAQPCDSETAMTTLVIGAAKSGIASANFLAGRGESVVLCD